MSNSPQPIGDAFQRAIEHWRRHQPDSDAASEAESLPPRLTIAFSREAGSGGKRIAEKLASRLQWPIYGRELVEKIAKDAGLSAQIVESVDEHRSSFLVETLEAFTGASTMGGAGYAHRLAQTLAALGAHGECVIVGRGASSILPRETTLSIRIVAPMNDRVAQYSQVNEVGQKASKAEVQRLDRERANFVKQYFHKDIADPQGYDLVINTSQFGDEACVELCLCAMRLKEAGLAQRPDA